MKLFHTSDWHLGRMLYGKSLIGDQEYFLERVFLPAVKREKPACVILSGDVYDRQIAPPEAIRLFDRTLSSLTELSCRVAVISGNHDSRERMAILKGALKKSGVYFSTELSDVFSPLVLEEAGEKAQLFLLPYFDPAEIRDYFSDDSLRGEGACMKRLIDEITPLFLPDHAHILVCHCFAAGSLSSDSESTLFAGGAGEVPPALFEPFDYVALGHLHGPQRAGEKGRYSGSPLKYSVDEASQKKSFVLLTLQDGVIEQEQVPIVPLRDVKRLSGLFEELIQRETPLEDYVELILEDKSPVLLAAQRLSPYYPNLLAVRNSWSSAQGTDRAKKLKNQDELTIFRSFLRDVCNFSPDEEEEALFKELLEEVRNP